MRPRGGARVRLEALALVNGSYEGDAVTGVFAATVPFAVRIDLDSLR